MVELKYFAEFDKIGSNYYANIKRQNSNGSFNSVDTFETVGARNKKEAYKYAKIKYPYLESMYQETAISRDINNVRNRRG